MTWPLSQDYNEAVQSPESSFSDPELQKGEVVCNALGIPMPRSGNFADVYEVRCPNGSRWAIKCFTRQVAGLRERYEEISFALQEARLPFTVEFTYLQEGIRIHGQWFPILKMQWVEGLTFNDFVRQNLDKPAMLEGLLQIWGRMAQRLRGAGIAHADLQHGNVLLVPGSTANAVAVKLIDYDGMFVPALARKPSGEVGHPSYQHPQRVREAVYSAEVDRFSLLLIATALRCVRVGGRALWERHDNGDNLLFREADLKTPDESKLFRELDGLSDGKAKTLVGLVRQRWPGLSTSVPLLEEVLPELAAPTATAKSVRSAPSGVQPAVAPVAPTQAEPAKRAATIQTAAAAAPSDAFAFDETAPVGKRRGGKKGAATTGTQPAEQKIPVALLWIGGAVAAGVLVLVAGIAGFIGYALSGKSGGPAPTEGQQAIVQPHDKDTGHTTPITPVTDPVKNPGPDPVTDPRSDPVRNPVKEPGPVNPVVRVDNGVLRLRHVIYPRAIIRSLAVSADGKLGLSCGSGGTIHLWDLETGAFRELKTRYNTVSGLAFLPDNKSFLFSANDGQLHFWQISKTEEGNQPEKEWTPLFNGKDLTGWKTHPDDLSRWSVQDGILVGEGAPGQLFTERNNYSNLHFRIEAQINDQGSGAQMVRATFLPSLPFGYAAQINATRAGEPFTGSLFPDKRMGYVKADVDKMVVPDARVKADEWFTQEILVWGNQVGIALNGKPTVNLIDKSNRARIGHLAIQLGSPGSVVRVRKAEVRELPDEKNGSTRAFGAAPPEGHSNVVNDLEVSADGKLALAASNDRIRSWDIDAGKRLPGEWPALPSGTSVVRLAANGKVAVSSDQNHVGMVWDVAKGNSLMTLGDLKEGNISAVAISPDGNLVVTGTNTGQIQFHEPQTKRNAVRELPNLDTKISALALSPDGRYVVAAGDSRPRRFLVVFDLVSGKQVQRLEGVSVRSNLLKFAAASPCLLAAGDDGSLRVYDIADKPLTEVARVPSATLREVQTVSENRALVLALTVTSEGKVVTVHGDGFVQVRDPEQALQVTGEFADPRNPRGGVVSAVRGQYAVVATRTGNVQLVDLRTGERKTVEDIPNRVILFVDVSEDGSLALIGSRTGNENVVDVRDLKKNKQLAHFSSPAILHTARFVPGGPDIVVGDNESLLRLLSIRPGKEERRFAAGAGGIRNLVVAPDGKRAVSSALDGVVRVWDLTNEKELYHFDRKPGLLPISDISPDGRLGLAQYGSGPTSSLLIWDLATGRALGSVEGGDSFRPQLCCFAGDGKHLVATTTDGPFTLKKMALLVDGVPPVSGGVKPPVATRKAAPPTDEAVAAAVLQLRESDAFKADYSKSRSGNTRDLKTLSEKLLAEAKGSKDDPVRRYALLTEARDLAGKASEAMLCLQAVDELAVDFAFDVRAARAAAMVPVGKSTSPPTAAAALTVMLALLEDALKEDDHEAAAVLLPPIRQTAGAAGEARSRPALERVAFAERLHKEYEAIRKDLQTLRDSPDDPGANLAVGRYRCFQKMEWDKGLPLLARGGDEELATAVKKDQAASGGGVAARLAAAEAWDHLTTGDAALRTAQQRRAYHWYALALPELSRADLPKAERRVFELLKTHPDFLTGWENVELAPNPSNLGGFVRLHPGQIIGNKTPLKGPVQIVAVVRSTDGLLHVSAFQDLRKLFTIKPNSNGTSLSVSWEKEGPGPLTPTRFLRTPMTKEGWTTVTIVFREDMTEIRTDGEGSQPIRETRLMDLTKPGKFRLQTTMDLEVRSFEVKPYKP